LKKLKKTMIIIFLIIFVCTSCVGKTPQGIAPFIYLSGDRKTGHSFVEYYPDEVPQGYLNKNVGGDHYLNSYNDGKRLYVSLGHALFVYDSETKRVTELDGYASNAIKKVNGEVWIAKDNGLSESGYSTSLCKVTEMLEVNCLHEAKNQQITDFYFDFDKQVFYGAGMGVSAAHGGGEYKVVKYNMQTGEEITLEYAGKRIEADRLTNICPGQFIVDGDIYEDTGNKIGEVQDAAGNRLEVQINDVSNNVVAFLGADNMSFEIYGCEDNETVHHKTIKLKHAANLYPVSHSWETTDAGEISMPIESAEHIFSYIGFQSVNLRTGEVQVHLLEEAVYFLHAVARFV